MAVTFLPRLIAGFFGTGYTTAEYDAVQATCDWAEGDPVIYHLKTKLGVNYDAGHWFHMAENFMVQHSKLRASRGWTHSSVVIYNFDKGE